MTLQLRRPKGSFGFLADKGNVPYGELVELADRQHRYCGGPMYLCNDEDCVAWIDALRRWGVIR